MLFDRWTTFFHQELDSSSAGDSMFEVTIVSELLHVWLCISGGRNCCQEIRKGVVYRLIEVEMDIKDINDFNL